MPLLEFRTPTAILLRRAQITLILAALVPTVLMTALGIVLIVLGGEGSANVLAGILVLAFCTSALTGYILGSIFLSRGASLAAVQNDFLSSVSHELRTPITSIRLYLDTLREERVTDPEERRNCLTVIDRELGRLDALVGRLLQLSRIESGRQIFQIEQVAVETILQDALATLEAVRLGAPLDLRVDQEQGLEVTGDRTALAQVVSNLLINAWKHGAAAERHILVRTRALGREEIEIAVQDNGPGMSAAELRRVFDPFERGRGAIHRRTEGVGLGLAIVRAIVRAHRGRVEASAAPGQGAEFRVLLPRKID